MVRHRVGVDEPVVIGRLAQRHQRLGEPPVGGRFAGTLAAADRRLAQALVTLREPSDDNGFVNAHPMAHHRWMPSIEKGAPDSLDELVASGSASVEAGPAWRGDATLELFDSPTEELARLEVREIIGGYYRQVGVTWNGGRLLADRGVPAHRP